MRLPWFLQTQLETPHHHTPSVAVLCALSQQDNIRTGSENALGSQVWIAKDSGKLPLGTEVGPASCFLKERSKHLYESILVLFPIYLFSNSASWILAAPGFGRYLNPFFLHFSMGNCKKMQKMQKQCKKCQKKKESGQICCISGPIFGPIFFAFSDPFFLHFRTHFFCIFGPILGIHFFDQCVNPFFAFSYGKLQKNGSGNAKNDFLHFRTPFFAFSDPFFLHFRTHFFRKFFAIILFCTIPNVRQTAGFTMLG